MANFPTWLPVVALALRDREGRWLMQQRLPGKHHGGLWEFPGGKLQGAESPRLALVREVSEELGIALDARELAPALLADDPDGSGVVLMLYSAVSWRGEPAGREGQDWGWFTPGQVAALALAPLDRELFARLL